MLKFLYNNKHVQRLDGDKINVTRSEFHELVEIFDSARTLPISQFEELGQLAEAFAVLGLDRNILLAMQTQRWRVVIVD